MAGRSALPLLKGRKTPCLMPLASTFSELAELGHERRERHERQERHERRERHEARKKQKRGAHIWSVRKNVVTLHYD